MVASPVFLIIFIVRWIMKRSKWKFGVIFAVLSFSILPVLYVGSMWDYWMMTPEERAAYDESVAIEASRDAAEREASKTAEESRETEEKEKEESRESEESIELGADKNHPYILNADEWFAEYCEAKTEKHIGQWVKVSGTVLTVSDYGDLKGYYLVGGQGSGLVCWVYSNELDAQYGQHIEYIGKVTVEDTKHIEMSDGHIESAEWPVEKPQSPITISEWSWSRDYVGGVEWNFRFTNNTEKTIKYITMEWNCYNVVGDLVYDEITRKSSYSIKYTGPLEAKQTTILLCNTTLFYSYSYNSAKLTKLQVEFMDGTIIRITDQGYSDIVVE